MVGPNKRFLTAASGHKLLKLESFSSEGGPACQIRSLSSLLAHRETSDMTACAFLSEEPVHIDSLQKTHQLTQLAAGTDSQQVPVLDPSDLRSCDAFVPTVKEEVEDPDYGTVPSVTSQKQAPQVPPPMMGYPRAPVQTFRFNQMTSNMAYPQHGYMTPSFYMMNGRPVPFLPRSMPGQSFGVIPQRVARPMPQMPHPWSLPVNVRATQVPVEKQSKAQDVPSPVQSSSETVSQISSEAEAAPIIKKEPLDEDDIVEVSSPSLPQVPIQQRPVLIPQMPQRVIPYPQGYPYMGLPFMPSRMRMKRKSPISEERRAKMMTENKEAFIDTFKAMKVPSLVGKHPVLLYKFKKDDEDYCYPFTLKRITRRGEVFSCSNCKQLREKDIGILVQKDYFQSDPTSGHGPSCAPNKWIEEVAKRVTYRTTQRVKMNDQDVDCREIHSQMCDDVSRNETLTAEEKDKVSDIIKNFPSKIRSIARARRMSKQRQNVEVGMYQQIMMMYPPAHPMMIPQMMKPTVPLVKIEDNS